MVSLQDLVETLSENAINLHKLLLSQVIAFVFLCSRLKNNILLIWPANQLPTNPPPFLPDETALFLQHSCAMSPRDVEACWTSLSHDIWHSDPILERVQGDRAMQKTFHEHGGRLYRECQWVLRL
jgi:hypothetical protein